MRSFPAVAGLALVLAALGGCRRAQPSEPAPAATGAPTPEPAVAAQGAPAAKRAPVAVDADSGRYVGSERCAECHVKKRDAWRKSWHAHALDHATKDRVAGNFHDAHFAGSSSEAWMQKRGERFVMRTRGADGALGDFAVDWLIGGKRMQDAVTVFPDGRWQVLPVYYQVTRGEWVDYTEAKQGRLDPTHPFFWANFRRMANRECLDCHVTDLRVRYDAPADRWTTEMTEPGVACEDCHGPGGRHAESSAPGDIFNPGKAAPALSLAVCGSCHGPRNPLFPLFDRDHRFVPGQRYEERYDPIVVLIQGRRSGDFFADGKPQSSSFEYQSFVQSACHRKGGATCVTCHAAPHDATQKDELRAAGDQACKGCHAAEFAAGSAHTQHRAAAAQSCVACHMPKIVSGVLDHFADHALDVPAPANTERHGVPNACGGCHRDKTPQALGEWLAAHWPKAAARQARRLRLADAFDDKTGAQSRAPLEAVLADEAEAPTLRGAAAVVLAERFPMAAGAIVPLLRDKDVLVRQKACEALAVARARPAADAIAAVAGDGALAVRQAAALALSALGDPRGPALLAALGADQDGAHLMQPHFVRGRILLHEGDLAGARRELEATVRLAPYHADALALLGEVAGRSGDMAGARRLIDEALRFDGTNQVALQLRQHLPPQ